MVGSIVTINTDNCSKDLASPHHGFTTISLLWQNCDEAHFGPLRPSAPPFPILVTSAKPQVIPIRGGSPIPTSLPPLREDHSPAEHLSEPREPPANASAHGCGTAIRSIKGLLFFLMKIK